MSRECCHASDAGTKVKCSSPMIRTGQAVVISEAFCNRCKFENVRCGETVKAVERVSLPPVPEAGPGTELHKLLGKLGWKESIGCQCKSRMRQMNAWGPAKCREEIDTIVGWLREEYDRRDNIVEGKKLFRMPFSAGVAKLLVKKAIRRAERD